MDVKRVSKTGVIAFAALLAASGCLASAHPKTIKPPVDENLNEGPTPESPASAPAARAWAIDCDPSCGRRLTQLGDEMANEMSAAIDPRDADWMIVSARTYDPRWPQAGWIDIYSSSDGGRSWKTTGPPAPLLTAFLAGEMAGDPTAVISPATGEAFVTYLHEGPEPQIRPFVEVLRSADGSDWKLTAARPFADPTDKPVTVVDPQGRLYVAAIGGLLAYSDDGAHWATKRQAATGMPAVGADRFGNVYAAWAESGGLSLFLSGDRGESFGRPLRLGAQADCGGMPLNCKASPAIAVAYETGAALAAWPDGTDVDLSYSADGGRNWSRPTRLPDMGGGSRFMASVAASPKGDFHVAWIEARDGALEGTTLYNVYYAHSPDGTRLDPPLQLDADALLPWNVAALGSSTGTPFFIGHYLGIAATDDRVLVSWPDTRDGRCEVWASVLKPV